jgi:hypothetical protein
MLAVVAGNPLSLECALKVCRLLRFHPPTARVHANFRSNRDDCLPMEVFETVRGFRLAGQLAFHEEWLAELRN